MHKWRAQRQDNYKCVPEYHGRQTVHKIKRLNEGRHMCSEWAHSEVGAGHTIELRVIEVDLRGHGMGRIGELDGG